ncbi:helix-turn-helix transcriptional regulator [Streptomyces sp. NPDC094466]|uniref:helix-turn-helix transcriptional regulator n=1 Tax=Streptomyces sp. NPDC094466 TaxID=3366065 RepID=UPI00382B5EA1
MLLAVLSCGIADGKHLDQLSNPTGRAGAVTGAGRGGEDGGMTRPILTQREASDACGVSRSTIRRRREAGDLPGAVQDEARGWLIPVEDLLAAGFRLNAPVGPDSPDVPPPVSVARSDGGRQEQGHGQSDDVSALRAE